MATADGVERVVGDRVRAMPAHHGVKELPQRRLPGRIAVAALPTRIALSLKYFRLYGSWPNLRHPRTFSEHLLCRTLSGGGPGARFVDKALIRDHVARVLGPENVPKRILLTTKSAIPWDRLPDRFAISATHGSSMTMLVNGQDTIDRTFAERIFQSWLARDYGRYMSEPVYKGIRPQLLIEESLCDAAGSPPVDYKFFCFGGRPLFVQVDEGRFQSHRRLCLDMEWQPLPMRIGQFEQMIEPPPRPRKLAEMMDIARLLSREFDFVRVDLYEVSGERVVFGELTFVPGGGQIRIRPKAWDYKLGRLFADAANEKSVPFPGPAAVA
jgi:hypothetical protein